MRLNEASKYTEALLPQIDTVDIFYLLSFTLHAYGQTVFKYLAIACTWRPDRQGKQNKYTHFDTGESEFSANDSVIVV